MRMPVLMLQAFAVEGRATRGTTEQKSFAHHVATGPDHVSYPLKTEHGIEDIKRNHRQSVIGISRSRRQERSHGTCFANAFLQNPSVRSLFVRRERSRIDGLIGLPSR